MRKFDPRTQGLLQSLGHRRITGIAWMDAVDEHAGSRLRLAATIDLSVEPAGKIADGDAPRGCVEKLAVQGPAQAIGSTYGKQRGGRGNPGPLDYIHARLFQKIDRLAEVEAHALDSRLGRGGKEAVRGENRQYGHTRYQSGFETVLQLKDCLAGTLSRPAEVRPFEWDAARIARHGDTGGKAEAFAKVCCPSFNNAVTESRHANDASARDVFGSQQAEPLVAARDRIAANDRAWNN
ncbi:hypothetical protein K3179_11125 [Qipengyuania sp. GH38]|nr:hypothetical protein [Qipengyuania intermedia]MBX7515095.1 hypothetical protein [Qipengyuania intermedia]